MQIIRNAVERTAFHVQGDVQPQAPYLELFISFFVVKIVAGTLKLNPKRARISKVTNLQ